MQNINNSSKQNKRRRGEKRSSRVKESFEALLFLMLILRCFDASILFVCSRKQQNLVRLFLCSLFLSQDRGINFLDQQQLHYDRNNLIIIRIIIEEVDDHHWQLPDKLYFQRSQICQRYRQPTTPVPPFLTSGHLSPIIYLVYSNY